MRSTKTPPQHPFPTLLTFHSAVSTFYLTMNSPVTEKGQLVDAGRRLDTKGFVAGSDGNLSLRLSDGNILVTPSGFSKGRLSEGDLVIVDLDGRLVSGHHRASSEIAMHLFAYRQRPDCRACVHSHPPFTTASAVVGRELPYDVLPEVTVFVGPIALTDYAPAGTTAVPESLAPFIADHDAFVLGNHGLLTLGRTIEEAMNRHETVEQFARIYHLALQMGEVRRLPEDDFARLDGMRRTLNERIKPA